MGEGISATGSFTGWVLESGTLYRLPSPPSPYDGLGFSTRNIANDGTAQVHYQRTSPRGSTGAVIAPPYSSRDDYAVLPVPDPTSTSTQSVTATDIEDGLVVGGYNGQAWTWSPGGALNFIDGFVADGTNGSAVVGRVRVNGEFHAAILGTTAQDLGTPGGTFNIAEDVNSSGWVAGYGYNAAGQDRAFA